MHKIEKIYFLGAWHKVLQRYNYVVVVVELNFKSFNLNKVLNNK